MKITSLPIPGAYSIETKKNFDHRGFFERIYCQKTFEEASLPTTWVNTNACLNKQKKITRGLHYQQAPYAEDKLITCLDGTIYDVFVDIRPTSPTYLKWFGFELTDNFALLIPQGCAHGYQTLTETALVIYQVTNFYSPHSEGGLLWNDPVLNITWPYTSDIIISEKDLAWSPLHKRIHDEQRNRI